MIGVALRIAASRISRPGRLACASARASAWRRMRSARFCLPPFMSLAENRAVIRLAGTTSYLVLRGMLVRRGMLLGLRAVLAATLLANEHARALLEVVADTPNVRRHLQIIRQAYPGDLAHGGVRHLQRHHASLRT